MVALPQVQLSPEKLRPPREALERLNARFQ